MTTPTMPRRPTARQVLRRRPLVTAVAATSLALAVLGGCSDSGDDDADATTTTVVVLGDAPESTEVEVEPGLFGAPDAATRQRCVVDADTLNTAIEAYRGLEGAEPASEADLVASGLIQAESVGWDVAVVDGTATTVPAPAPDGCTP